MSSVRERNILRERRNSPATFMVLISSRGCVIFLTEYTEEQNTQHSTETLSQPISQNLIATEASPPALLRMERGVITEIPLYVLRMFSSPSPPFNSLIGVTSHTTPLSIRRGAGGDASVISVCRRRSVRSKLCAKKLCQICVFCEKKTLQRERKNLYEVYKQADRGNLTYY